MPHRYQDWKALAVGALSDQAKAQVLDIPITSATVQIELMGKHPRRGDLDNIAGSILDVLVQAGILRDDSISVVSSLTIALEYSSQPPMVQIQLGNFG
jgi:Holliday junction resolvase RusA-like endonuclease